MSALQPPMPPVLQRLRLAASTLEDAEMERDAAIAPALADEQPGSRVTALTGIPVEALEAIARRWNVAPPGQPVSSITTDAAA